MEYPQSLYGYAAWGRPSAGWRDRTLIKIKSSLRVSDVGAPIPASMQGSKQTFTCTLEGGG